MAPHTRANLREDTRNPTHEDGLTSLLSNIMVELKDLRVNQISMHANQTSLFEEIVALKEAHASRSVTPKSVTTYPVMFLMGTMGRRKIMRGMENEGEGTMGMETGCMGDVGIEDRNSMRGLTIGSMGGMIDMGGIDTMWRNKFLDMTIPLNLSSTHFPSFMASLITKPTWNGSPKWTKSSHSITIPRETR